MPSRTVSPATARAHAKLTLALRILGPRDDGYHEIDAVAVSLNRPADLVEVELTEEPGISVSVGGRRMGVPEGRSNLAARAAASLLEWAGWDGGAAVRIDKAIPAQAGLGGGSADAAATLVGLNGLLAEPVPAGVLAEIGAGLGSDVPFCLRGGVARLRGRGERIEPLSPLGDPEFLVAVPMFGLSTAAVYAAWDDLGRPHSQREVPVPAPWGLAAEALSNDLEPAAETVDPRLAEFRLGLESVTGWPSLLAGSGPAYAVVCPPGSEPDVSAIEAGLEEAGFVPALVTRAGPHDRGVGLEA